MAHTSMASVARIVNQGSILRGDYWPGMTCTFNYTGHDFTGTTATVHLRVVPDGDLLHAPVCAVAYPSLGVMTVTFSVAGSVTALFPVGTIYGDVELSRSSPAWGPRTWYRFSLSVIPDISHA